MVKPIRGYELVETIENTDNRTHERLINEKWVKFSEIKNENEKLVDEFPLELFENMSLEQCKAFRDLFNKLLGVEFRPYLRCTRITKNCVSSCQFLDKCRELNPKLSFLKAPHACKVNLTNER